MITLNIPEPTPSLNVIVNKHWSKVREFRAHWSMLVLVAKNHANVGNWAPFHLSRVRVVRENYRLLDDDNFRGGMKYLIDGLRDQGLIVNDDAKHLVLVAEQVKVPKCRYPKTLVYIENAAVAEAA